MKITWKLYAPHSSNEHFLCQVRVEPCGCCALLTPTHKCTYLWNPSTQRPLCHLRDRHVGRSIPTLRKEDSLRSCSVHIFPLGKWTRRCPAIYQHRAIHEWATSTWCAQDRNQSDSEVIPLPWLTPPMSLNHPQGSGGEGSARQIAVYALEQRQACQE